MKITCQSSKIKTLRGVENIVARVKQARRSSVTAFRWRNHLEKGSESMRLEDDFMMDVMEMVSKNANENMSSQISELLPSVYKKNKRASPHFHKEATDFLNRKFPEKLIDRGGLTTWPPRSPDFTPLDCFCLGGGITSRMCHHWLPLCRNFLGR
jgi:ATP-dependent protease HslVU (ClpYQ) ATPase subunit